MPDDPHMKPVPVDLRLVVNDQIELIVTHLHDREPFIQVDARCRHCRTSLTSRRIPHTDLAKADLGGIVDARIALAHADRCPHSS
jgi:hypothetical protein